MASSRAGKDGRGIATGPVDDAHRDGPDTSLNRDLYRGPGGVFHGIGNRFLDEPVSGISVVFGQAFDVAHDLATDGQARGARPAYEPLDDMEAGPRPGRC